MIVASVILIFLTLALGIISFKSVESLGNYSNKVNKENIIKGTSEIILENTRETSRMYSGIFSEAENYSKILADLCSHYLDNPNYYDKPDQFSPAITELFDKGFTSVNSPKYNVSICYWGGQKPAPLDLRNSIKAITYLSKATAAIDYFYPYSDEVWVNNLKDEYLIGSPNFSKRKIIIDYKEAKAIFKPQYQKYKDLYRNEPHKINHPIWLGHTAKFTKSGRDLCVRYPVFDVNKDFIGFAGIDIDVDNLVKRVLDRKIDTQSKISKKGQMFLLTNSANIVALPGNIFNLFAIDNKRTKAKFYFDPDYKLKLSDSKYNSLKNLSKTLISTKHGTRTLKINNKAFFVSYCRITTNDWIVVSILPMENILLPIQLTKIRRDKTIAALLNSFVWVSIAFVIFAIILSYLLFSFFVNTPIKKLRNIVLKIGHGKFNIKAQTKGVKEISDLAGGINKMSEELTEYVVKLKAETKKNQVTETELEIAADIQKSVLPKITDEFIREEFDIYANLIPAKYVSGDFYDLFFVNNDTLAIVLADVSGKGISAAFFMSMAKVVIKNSCLQAEELDPAAILTQVNKLLCKDNDNCMFLTMYLLFYEIKTGRFSFSNAGHHDNIKVALNGNISYFGKQGNQLIGMFSDATYKQEKRNLQMGDTILLYTDGISDARNPDNEEYGVERISKILHLSKKNKLEEIGDEIAKDVLNHECGNRFDDITLVMLRRQK